MAENLESLIIPKTKDTSPLDSLIIPKNGISVTVPEIKDSPLNSIFKELQPILQDVTKEFNPANIENSFKVDLFGAKLTLPRITTNKTPATKTEEGSPYKALFNANAKELGVNDQNLSDDSPTALYHQDQIAQKFIADVEYLQTANPDEISQFVKDKKQSLLSSAPLNESYEVDQDYVNASKELDNVAKFASFNNAPFLYKDIDKALQMSSEDLRKATEQIGNDVQNVTNDASRATFKARGAINEGNVKYDQLYKDQLAYTGIQSEIYASQKDISRYNEALQSKLNEFEDLTLQLQQDPQNKQLLEQIQLKADEIKPIKEAIDKNKAFITKLSEASLDLPEFDRELQEQAKADLRDAELQEQFGSSVGRPIGLAIQGLSNRLTSTLKGSALIGNELARALGTKSEEDTEIIKQNLLLDNTAQFTLPTRIKEGKVINWDKDGKFSHVDWNVAFPMAIQSTGEMLLMGGVAAPLAKLGTLGELGGLYLGAASVFGGDILENELKKGTSFNEALAITGLRLGIEAATERLNPLEFVPFNGISKKAFSKTISKADFIQFVGENWQGFLPKLKAKGIDAYNFLKGAAKAMVLEPVEEVMSDLGNYGLDEYVVNHIKPDYTRDTDLTLQNEITTALTTALTMAPMAVYQGYSEAKAEKYEPSLRWKAAITPKLFLTNLEDNFKKGAITKEFYEIGKKEVEAVSSLYNIHKAKIDLTPENEQPDYLDALYQHDKVQKQFLDETDPTKKEKLSKQVENAAKRVAVYDEEAIKLVNNPAEIFKKKEDIHIQNIKDFASTKELEQASIEDLNTAKSVLNEVVSNPFSEKVKEQAVKQIEAIDNQIIEKSKPIEETPTQVFEKLKKTIPTLTKEEVDKEIEIALNKEGLSEKEQEEYYDLLSTQLDILEKTSKLIPTFKDKQGKEFSISKDTRIAVNGEVFTPISYDSKTNRLTGKYLDGSTEISLNPNDFSISIDKKEIAKILSKKTELLPEGEDSGFTDFGTGKALSNADLEKASIEVLQKELEDSEQKLRTTLLEDSPITKEEFEKLALRVKELREQLNIPEPPKDNTEEKQDKEQETANKEAEVKIQKVFYPFSTTPQQSTSTGIASESFIQAQANTLNNLRQGAETKPYSEQGVYVTVMNNSFPLDDRHQPTSTLNAVKNKEITEERVKQGRIAVLTDKSGNPLYFNTEGEKSTKEKGFVVYQPLRGRIKDGELDLSNQNIPTKEELKQAGASIRFSKDIEKLKEVRLSKEPIILNIEEITKGVQEFDKTEISKINLSENDLVLRGGGIVKSVNRETKLESPIYRPTIKQAGLSDFVLAFMNMSNKEGLSEELKNSWQNRKDFLEKLIYTNPNVRQIRFNSDKNLILTSGENIENLPVNIVILQLNRPFDWYTWDGSKFIPNNFATYQGFLSDKLSTREVKSTSFNSYIKLGDPIIKDVTPIEEAAKTEEKPLQETPIKKTFQKSDRAKGIKINTDAKGLSGFGKNTDLKRVKLLGKKVTTQQNQQAKEWFDTYLSNSGAKFEDLRDIVNSDAYATWSTSAIKLWQGGDFTDLYHEAFHDFTQIFLTKEQKESLYSELRETKPNLSDFEAEELLAEDFRKYMLSGQKLILNQRVKRNTIFRRMYNFLKELFTGTPSLEVIYQKLATGNIASYNRNVENALFGILNKNVEGLTFTESINLYKALDSLIAKQFRAFKIPISRLFKEPQVIEATYQQVVLDLKASLDENEEYYNSLVDKYNSASELEQQSLLPEISELDKLINNLSTTLENFTEVRAKHLQESEFLKISKKFVPEEIIDELEPETKDSIYDDKEQQSAKDRTSDQIIYLLGSLPKFVNKAGEKVNAYNSYLSNIEDITEFDLAWNRLAKALTGTRDYKTMIVKIQELTKTNPEYQYLLEALPNPNTNGKDLSLLEIQLRNQFINTFSQPYIPLKYANWWRDKSNGELRVNVKEAIGKSYDLLSQDWDDNIQSIPNPYRILDPTTGQYFIDMDKIAKDFQNLSKLRTRRKEEFLDAIGFTFSPQTIESPEYQDFIKEDPKLGRIYDAIKAFVDLKNGLLPQGVELTDTQIENLKKPVISVIDAIKQTTRVQDLRSIERVGKIDLISGQKENIEALQNIEITYSDKYFSDNLLNSEASNVWAIRPWSQQSVLYNYLNNPKFTTYQELINDPVGAYFDTTKNPDADNIYLNSVFDLKTGRRRTDKKGKPIELKLYNHNGLSINFGENVDGSKTTSLSRFEKLIQDIAPLLLSGNKEHIRYGDKTTSNGTETRFSRLTDSTTDNPYLPVDIKNFRETYLPKEAKVIFRNILHSALLQTNQYFTQNVGKNFDNLNKNLENKEYWGYFDGILSKETKNKLLEDGLITTPQDIYALIDKNQKLINRDLEEFLKSDVEQTKKEILSNDLLSTEDFIPKSLLTLSPFGETEQQRLETIIRAFTINSYILNLEHTRFMFQDPRFYANKNASYREGFKRYSKASSTGTIGVNDDQQNEFLQGSRLEKKQYDLKNPDNKSPDWSENGIENSVIFDDVQMSADDFIEEVDKIYKGKPLEEQLAVKKAYGDITSTDAFGFCTFDWYRQWEIRSGNDNWNNEKEELYRKIVTNQPISEDENTKAFLFFPPKKIRVVGYTFDEKTNRFLPVDYKFAVSPLLPQVLKDKAFGAVRDNMLRQNISIGLFKSGSKHSSITKDGKNNKFYNPDGSVNTEDYTTNPIYTEFIFEVVPSPNDYKEEVTFSTQLRKLLFVNQFNNGYPVDYKEKDWNTLSETEKKKASKIYRLEQEFGDTIDKLVSNEKERLLKTLGVTIDKDGNYNLSEEKFSQLLEQEFKSRNLPNNVLKSIQLVKGKFKYSLDASLQRETIEQVILSIVDNRLRKQKGLGESLIQATSVGYENFNFDRVGSWKSINGNDLPFYQYNKDQPTSPQKVKIALQGDFKKLLNLPQVQNLSKRESITPLEALNQLLKDNEFSKTIKDLITITGVRIPVQGHNSMEFMEVGEFLPEEAGSVIIVSPALVAKSGGDFDWDKITSLYTSFNVTEAGTLVYPNSSEKVNKLAYNELRKEFEERVENRPDFYDKLLQSIFNISPQELQEELLTEDIFQNKSIPSLALFNKLQTKKALNNNLNSIIRQVLEQPEMYEQLVTPNSTYLFEPIADERQKALSKKKPTYSDIPKVTESLNQFESNTVGKQSLGIGAIWNTLFAQMQKAGVSLEKTYITNITGKKPTVKHTANRLPHNHTKDGNVSLSGIFSQPYKDTKYRISETISQLMNGWVDVAKKDWVFYINGRKEVAPTLLYAATTGIHKDVLIGFFNQPIIYDFVKNLQKYKSSITKFKNPTLFQEAKKNAIWDTLKQYLDNIEDPNGNLLFTNEGDEPYNDMRIAVAEDNSIKFWTALNKMRLLANTNEEAFNPDSFMKFAIPVDGKLEKPTTEQEKFNQALYLIQFLEFQEQGSIIEKLRRVVNQDTEKPVNIQYSKERQVRRSELKDYGLISEDLIEKMANESVIKAFTHTKTGLDKFIQNLTETVFEVTNHPIFNRFLYEEFNKPTEKNNIPFSIKFDIYEDWVKAVKNQFIEYLYQNYVYKPNTTEKVAKYVFQMMKPSTALALELENIKKTNPELAENNLLLQFLIRDNSREKLGGKPKIVNLKLRKDRIDTTTQNVLTEAFEQLLNSDQSEIQQFAKKLAHFAFVQSGLTKSPISFSNLIPQEAYGEDISNIIKAFSELMTTNPEVAKRQLQRFYDDFFKQYNRKFFISNQVLNEETAQYENDIDFQKEAFRGKNYIDSRAYDLLSKKQNNAIKDQQDFLNSIKTISQKATAPFTETTAKENPNNFYIYEFNESLSGKLGSSKVRGDVKNPEKNTSPIILMKQARIEGGNWTDTTYTKNIELINSSISEAVTKIQQLKPKSIIFPQNLTEFSKLREFAPKTADYLFQALNDTFGIQENSVKFEEIKEEVPTPIQEEQPISTPIEEVKESKEEDKEGCDPNII